MEHPLAGLRILDLADEKGELCGRLLADLGAEVIRVERPGGARSRRLPPFAPDGETSLYFAFRNAGKRSLVLDLEAEADRERLLDLCDEADVVIESEGPGALDALGVGPAAMLQRSPALVVTSISDFGCSGPYRDFAGTDMVGFAMGGMMFRAGAPERPPVVAPGALAYDTAGATAAMATLLAYWQRLATGRGQHLDISVMESVANLSDWALPNFSLNAQAGQRAGAGIYTLYRCSDGWVRMIVLVKHHWRRLLEWMGNPEELSDPKLDDFIQRLLHMPAIEAVVEKFTADKEMVAIARELQELGIPATPLFAPDRAIANEHTEARGSFAPLAVGEGLVARAPSGFLHVDGQRVGPAGGAPALGDHGAGGFRSAPLQRSQAAGRSGPPLAGLRVVDFGIGAAGVEIGRLLAEYGADVIKVESRRAPDFIRAIMGNLMNANFASSNRSKRSFGVDLKCERGRELVRQLVAGADVVIENNATGVMERLGLDYASLQAVNPGVVMVSSQMVGSTGPWKDWSGYGPSTHAVSGLQYLWNYPEDVERPAGSTNVFPDHFIGRLGTFAALAGLIRRSRTGQGMHADAAQFEAAIQLLGDLFAQESLAPGSVGPLGNESSRGAPWGAYPCAGEDEWCVVNVRDDGDWQGLVTALGEPEWATRPVYREASGRIAHRAQLDAELESATRLHGARMLMERLQAHRVPAGIVAHGGYHLEDPHLAARGYLRRIAQQDLGEVVLEGPAFRGSALGEPRIEQAPRLGEHTREICRELLGLSDGEVEALYTQDVLEDPPPA